MCVRARAVAGADGGRGGRYSDNGIMRGVTARERKQGEKRNSIVQVPFHKMQVVHTV